MEWKNNIILCDFSHIGKCNVCNKLFFFKPYLINTNLVEEKQFWIPVDLLICEFRKCTILEKKKINFKEILNVKIY